MFGAYVVIRDSLANPEFLPRSVGGHWKGVDRTETPDALGRRWVVGTTVICLGAAGIEVHNKSHLRGRLSELRRYGQVEAVPHAGGCRMRQLSDHSDLLVGWLALRVSQEETRTPAPEPLPRQMELASVCEWTFLGSGPVGGFVTGVRTELCLEGRPSVTLRVSQGGNRMKYGRHEEVWENLLLAGHEFLKDVARRGRSTSYTELNAVLVRRTGHRGFDFSQAEERSAMGYLLGKIVDKDRMTNPTLMISAIVIYLNKNDAGGGFYAKAQQDGLFEEGMSKDRFWIDQVNAVHAHFSSGRSPRGIASTDD